MATKEVQEMLQQCVLCKKIYGRVPVAADDPAAGQVSHGFCPDCVKKPEVQKKYFGKGE